MRSSETAVVDLMEVRSPRERKKKPGRSALRHRLEYAAFYLALGALRLLPPGGAAGLGRALARAFFRLASARRRILFKNLLAAFPEKSAREIASIARGCVATLGAAFMDFLEVSNLPREEFLDRAPLTGVENLEAARARGRGVFLLSAHFGGWEIGALRVGLLGEAIAVVVRPLDNPLLEAELARRRTRFGNRVIAKREATRGILRAMRANETVAILIDQNVLEREAIFVPFFGRLAATTSSLALLQLKTGAAVVPVFTWPIGGGRYETRLEPPIWPEEFETAGTDRAERVRRATARYVEVNETAVRKKPSAWLWMHNRWRTRPPDA
ncbi:MAG: lysophospholipid acyltransferase family protein [Thermoanaerobaculia bacterium]